MKAFFLIKWNHFFVISNYHIYRNTLLTEFFNQILACSYANVNINIEFLGYIFNFSTGTRFSQTFFIRNIHTDLRHVYTQLKIIPQYLNPRMLNEFILISFNRVHWLRSHSFWNFPNILTHYEPCQKVEYSYFISRSNKIWRMKIS